jgi:hypothetical protein
MNKKGAVLANDIQPSQTLPSQTEENEAAKRGENLSSGNLSFCTHLVETN